MTDDPNQCTSSGQGEPRGVDLGQFIHQWKCLRRGYIIGFRGTNGGFRGMNNRVDRVICYGDHGNFGSCGHDG